MAPEPSTSELGRAVQDVTEKAQLLIREEIELAKADMTAKVSKLIRSIVIGVIAGVFALFGLIYLLHGLSWLIWDLIGGDSNFFLGFLIVAALLFILGGLAGFLAARFIKRGTPPTPQMAIEEAKLIQQTLKTPTGSGAYGEQGAAVAARKVR